MTSFLTAKLLALLAYPLGSSLLLSLFALLFARFRWLRSSFYALLLSFGWLYLCSTALFANFLMAGLERDVSGRAMSVIEPADAIVLLGGAMRGDAHMSNLPDMNQHGDRLLQAVALYKAGKAPFILASGGSLTGYRSEARQMKDVLMVMGVPAEAILLENQSRNTYENALYSVPLLHKRKAQRVLLVTSAFHMRRARGVFEDMGVQVVPAPADYQIMVAKPLLPVWLPDVGNLTRTTIAMHEIFGFWTYRWRGWL